MAKANATITEGNIVNYSSQLTN